MNSFIFLRIFLKIFFTLLLALCANHRTTHSTYIYVVNSIFEHLNGTMCPFSCVYLMKKAFFSLTARLCPWRRRCERSNVRTETKPPFSKNLLIRSFSHHHQCVSVVTPPPHRVVSFPKPPRTKCAAGKGINCAGLMPFRFNIIF